MQAAAWVSGQPGQNIVVMLANNDARGRSLALHAILASMSAEPRLAGLYQFASAGSAQFNVQAMVDPLSAVIPGVVSTGAYSPVSVDAPSFLFRADGTTWIERASAPLAIIPPGYVAAVGPLGFSLPQTYNQTFIFASFLWSLYNSQ